MGRFSRKRKNFNQGGDNAAKKQNNGYDKNWKKTEPKSERFEAYYKSQNIIPENEWDDFLGALKKHLPVTFRITDGSFNIFAEEIKQQLEKHFSKGEQIVKVDDQDITVEPPTPISWYPNKGAWRFNVGRTVLRKVPELESFHKFIIYQTEMGNMTRQEEVSMVPPFFLNIEPHHHVLDMCAAPGSKTIQLTEMLHSKDKDDKPPSGIIIANDVDQGRCYMLTHQVKRLGSPCVFITNHEAQAYPILKVITKNEENKEVKVLYQFDRILCDVPCSGDGTLRKNMELWKRWHSGMGVGLHRLQLKIASKGVELLKVGGRMVYSTCSFNPIEDEAIVCQLLRKYKGKIRLVDVSNEYPLMKRRTGLTTWKIQDKDGTVYKDFDHVCSIPKKAKVFVRSLFPPTEEEVKEFHLERCMRFFPHLGDTGGFFVTVIEKIASTAPVGNDQKAEEEKKKEEEEEKEEKEILSELQSEVPELFTEIGAAESNSFDRKKKRGKGEDPFLPFPPEMKSTWDEIKNFYGITDGFPTSQLMIRSEQSKKIYFISPGSLELFKTDQKGSLTIVNAGVKIFARADQKGGPTTCSYRVVSEGLRWLLPYLTKRKVVVSDEEFKNLLQTKDPFFHTFELKTRETLAIMEIGPLVFVLASDSKLFPGYAVSGWRGKVSVHLQVAKKELQAIRKLVLNEDATPSKFSKEEEKSEIKTEVKTEVKTEDKMEQ